MPKISAILGEEKFNALIAAGASDEEIELLAKKTRKQQLQEQNSDSPTSTPGQTGNYFADNDNLGTKIVRGAASGGIRMIKAADYAAESIGFDLVSDTTTDKLNKDQEDLENARKRVSQEGLSKERLEELKNLEDQSANASTTWENVKAGVNQMVDIATHPSEWTLEGTVETLADPLNAVSFGTGGIAAKVGKTFLGKVLVGGTAGAVEGAVVNSGYEYAVAKGGNASDEEAKKIAIQSAAGGAAAGATFGAVGGVTFRQKKAADLKDKSTSDILENDLLKIDEEAETIESRTTGETSVMTIARDVLKEYDNDAKTIALDAITDDNIYNKLPKDLKEKVNQLREYEAYQEAMNPDAKKKPNPLDDFKQKVLTPEEIHQRMNDSIKAMPEVKVEETANIDQKFHEVQEQYKVEKLTPEKVEEYTPDFQIVHENLPATLRELVDTEIIDPEAAAQIEYKNKVLQLQNKGVIYANFEGWSENIGNHVVDALNAKKINDLQKVEVESNAALDGVVKIQDELIQEGATPQQVKDVVNRRFLPTKLETNISNTLNDGQPIENRYSGFRLRELTNKTIEFLENPDIEDLKIKLQNANVQGDLQKAVLDSVMNKDINLLDQFISEKLTNGVKESNDAIKTQVKEKLQLEYQKQDTEYKSNVEKAKINDFGEKIGGARKDFARRYLDIDDLDNMNDLEASENVVKKNLWKPLNYKKMKDENYSPEMTSYTKKIKDALPSKPIANKEAQANFISFVNDIKDIVSRAEDIESLSKDIETYIKQNFKDLDENGNVKSSYSPWNSKAKLWAKQGVLTNKFLRQYSVSKRNDGYMYFDSKRNVKYLDKDWNSLIKESGARTVKKDGKTVPKKPYLSEIKREGRDWRDGKDIKPEVLQETFGFRAGEFGNWVNQKERQSSLNSAYDGLLDLAEVLKIDPKAISLNGELAIAFGARGKSKALAHYEPGRVVINLTKIKGAGSLAHEWFHALDNYIGKMGKMDQIEDGVYASELSTLGQRFDRKTMNKYLPNEGINIDLIESYKKVAFMMENKREDDASTIARVQYKISELDNQIKNVTDKKKSFELYKEKRQLERKLAMIESGDTDYIKTNYFENASALDGTKSKKYWQSRRELIARAFESYIFDKSKKSDYLVNGVEESRFNDPRYKGNPYPTGQERININSAFDELFDSVTGNNLKGFEKVDMKKFDDVVTMLEKGC